MIAPAPGRDPLLESVSRVLRFSEDDCEAIAEGIHDALDAVSGNDGQPPHVNGALGALATFEARMDRLRRHVEAARTLLMIKGERL